jgi:poly-gamma-glutamate capsule biosynthesis protein CapA/YwtB (metallophosphatase superfamily)
LLQTLDTLHGLTLATAGAGRNANEAAAPAILDHGDGRELVFGFAARDSGVPRHWSAREDRPGVYLLESLGEHMVNSIKAQVSAIKRKGDVAVASIHWGSNWGYDIPPAHITFAHALIDEAMIDLVHGHSSHHAKGWEIHNGKLILYGCGDFLNDYEGISGWEEYRSDLTLMYLPTLDPDNGGRLASLSMVPFQIRKFNLNRASRDDATWICSMLNDQCRSKGTRLQQSPEGVLQLQADAGHSVLSMQEA